MLSFDLTQTSKVEMTQGTIRIAKDLCKGCELCVASCPQECISMSPAFNARGYRFAVLAADTCTGCSACAIVCPDCAISVLRTARKSAA